MGIPPCFYLASQNPHLHLEDNPKTHSSGWKKAAETIRVPVQEQKGLPGNDMLTCVIPAITCFRFRTHHTTMTFSGLRTSLVRGITISLSCRPFMKDPNLQIFCCRQNQEKITCPFCVYNIF